jgi:hypothetical protein
MSTPSQIQVAPGTEVLGTLGHLLSEPSSVILAEMVIATAMSDEGGYPPSVLNSLVCAYIEMESFMSESEGTGFNFSLVQEKEAEQLYREFAIKGFRKGVSESTVCNDTDDEVYERCSWYEYEVANWPDQLIAEIAYAIGYRDAKQAEALYRYAEEQGHV